MKNNNNQIVNDLFDDDIKSPPPEQAQVISLPPKKNFNVNTNLGMSIGVNKDKGKDEGKTAGVNMGIPTFALLGSNMNSTQQGQELEHKKTLNNNNDDDDDEGESTPKQNQKKAFDFNKLNIRPEFDFNAKANTNANVNANVDAPNSKYSNLRDTELFSGFTNNQGQGQNPIQSQANDAKKPNAQLNSDKNQIPNVSLLNQNINFDALLDNIDFKDDVQLDSNQIKAIEDANKKQKMNQSNKAKKQQINDNDLFNEFDYNDNYNQPHIQSKSKANSKPQSKPNQDNIIPKAIDLSKIGKYNQANGSVRTKAHLNYLSLKKDQFINRSLYPSFTLQSLTLKTANANNPGLNSDIDPEALSLQLTSDLEDILNNNNDLVNKITSQFSFDYSSLSSSHSLPIGQCKPTDSNSATISSIRDIQCNGDGLYLGYMFSLGEQLINEGNSFELKQLAYGVSIKINKPFVYRDVQIDKNEVLIVFSFIFNALETGSRKEANDYWLKSFITNLNFSLGMIKYAKVMLAEYITEHCNEFNIEELIKSNLINEGYITNEGTKLNVKDYLAERVLRMESSDDEGLLIYLMPIVFKRSLSVYYTESQGQGQSPDNGVIKKRVFPTALGGIDIGSRIGNHSKYSIALMFKDFKYCVAYEKEYYNVFNGMMAYVDSKPQAQSQKRISLFCENSHCDICGSTSDEIIFEHMPSSSFCKNCLTNALNKAISMRISMLINEEYSNVQYYLRPISLSSNEEQCIANEDLKELIGSSIIDRISFLMKNTCLLCSAMIDFGPYIDMPCGCKLCLNCAGAIVLKDTDDKIILNAFEQKFLKLKPSKCACGNPFDSQYAVPHLYTQAELEPHKKKSMQRMEMYTKRYCILCKEAQRHNPINMQGENKMMSKEYYIMIPINSQESNLVNGEHIMCKACSYIYKGKINEMLKKGEIDKKTEDVDIDCAVCGQGHSIKVKLFKSLTKENEVTCCLIW